MASSPDKYLAHFLGPKAENADILESLVVAILRDYSHWRRNYFPGDGDLIRRSHDQHFSEERERLHDVLTRILADLRRSFPFHSPRYIAHQQSETSIPALLGSLAGLLYNSNNVTSESGAVTLEWEITATARILELLGFIAPPVPATSRAGAEAYYSALERQFGWCHLTSGGTVANLEALWAARATTIFPLAVRDAAESADIALDVKLPSYHADMRPNRKSDIRNLSDAQLLNLRPNESLFLLKQFLERMVPITTRDAAAAAEGAWDLLRSSSRWPQKGIPDGVKFRVFVSGTAHYSIRKALDVLGIGIDSLVQVEVDSRYRMLTSDLDRKLSTCVKEGAVPLAVIGIAGTTEEGSVDPIHGIIKLREKYESKDISFWIHVDAAWGGYFRTLLRSNDAVLLAQSVSRHVGITAPVSSEDLNQWAQDLEARTEQAYVGGNLTGDQRRVLDGLVRELQRSMQFGSATDLVRIIRTAGPSLRLLALTPIDDAQMREALRLGIDDRVAEARRYVSETFELAVERPPGQPPTAGAREYRKKVTVSAPDPEVLEALWATAHSDSVTIDPHKMGFIPYPSGAIAFANDWVRYLLKQKAPYITVLGGDANTVVHRPPHHVVEAVDVDSESGVSLAIEAFAPYTLEGSRPSFPAVSLYASTSLMPLTQTSHGAMVRSSWLAARNLYEWLVHFDDINTKLGVDNAFRFVPITTDAGRSVAPDTNIVVFGIQPRVSREIRDYNKLTESVYKRFSIRAELGERQYSYSQPFFLSSTRMTSPEYSYRAVTPFLETHGFRHSKQVYERDGIFVLRATVMNPYLEPMRVHQGHDLIREFVMELGAVPRAV